MCFVSNFSISQSTILSAFGWIFVLWVCFVMPFLAWLGHVRKAASPHWSVTLLHRIILFYTLFFVASWLCISLGTPLDENPSFIHFITCTSLGLIFLFASDMILLKLSLTNLDIPNSSIHANFRPLVNCKNADLIAYINLFVFLAVCCSWEELFFRGFLFTLAHTVGLPTFLVVMLSSILFGLQHFRKGGSAVIATSIYGLFFSCLFIASGSLYCVMIVHVVGNVLSFIAADAISAKNSNRIVVVDSII